MKMITFKIKVKDAYADMVEENLMKLPIKSIKQVED